ncbi:uncharacterized protein F5891DRAFT_999585 [Suillus fuscotomentosus]|uniref:Uncharacterized protein n=1 Tax=Suillus fuscotomentosus TaxID=1912939 RepID=A0AAD4HSI0_9AGAM|nr:uncharacterized protein F5891DRAFT_999585 [Suillus fuscotomentosus]KAG1906956.1 hypothetical protein F5891DRAFT_999585 [Suillus fuscotomentosus]
MHEDKTNVIVPMPDHVQLNTSSAVDAVSAFSTSYPELPHLHVEFDKTGATSIETLGFDCPSVTRQETKCNQDFYVPEPVLHRPPCTPGNETVVSTGSGAPGVPNITPPLIERQLSVIPKEEFVPVEHPANNSLDSISSAIIPDSFEASESLSSLSPCKNSIIIPDVASTNNIRSILESATEHSMENTDRTYTTTPIKSEGTEVPVAVTYADATNLAARYPDLASQILVSPLRQRTTRQELALTAEHDLIEEDPPSKRRHRRHRRHRSKRSRKNQEESQQQSRGSLRTPGPDPSLSPHKDPSPISALVDPKGTSGFHSAYDSRQPVWLVDSALSNPSVKRAPSFQTNRHMVPATLQERTRNYQRESGDTNWNAPAAEIQASTLPPMRFATPKRAPVQEQHIAMLLQSEERAGATKAMDLATASIGRRSSNAEMLLTELFRKAMETSSPSATKHNPLRKCQAEGPDSIKVLVAETAHPVSQAEKIMEGDSPRVKLPAPSTPPMRTSPNPTRKSPTAWMEEDHTIRQSYTPPGARTQDHTLRQSYVLPAARTEDDYIAHQSYLPPAARATEDHATPQNYMPPHQRLNKNKYNTITTQKLKPHIHHHASSLNRHSNPCTPPSPGAIELLERSERIRHLERLLSKELPISTPGLTMPSLKPAQMLQPIGPWRASDEKAFHERGAISPGTSTNESLDLVRVMQAMGLDISSRKDTLASLGNSKPSVVEHNSFDGVRRQSGTTMENAVVRNDFARAVRSQGLRSPRGGGGYRSVSGESLETDIQWTRYT